MANLSPVDKLRLENAFGMKSGYVLDFSNFTFRAFIQDTVGLDIESPKYQYNSGSKANRLRAFFSAESDAVVGKLLCELLKYLQETRRLSGRPLSSEETLLHQECLDIAGKLLGLKQSATPSGTPTVLPNREVLNSLSQKLLGLTSLAPHPRGYAFEKFLQELFAAFHMSPKRPFRVVGEQIDGSLDLDRETYLIEAKWQNAPIDAKELYAFHMKISGKAAWTRGLFVSYTGFSRDSFAAYSKGHPANFIILDGLDLHVILAGENGRFLDLPTCLREKIRCLAETGSMVSASDVLQGL